MPRFELLSDPPGRTGRRRHARSWTYTALLAVLVLASVAVMVMAYVYGVKPCAEWMGDWIGRISRLF